MANSKTKAQTARTAGDAFFEGSGAGLATVSSMGAMAKPEGDHDEQYRKNTEREQFIPAADEKPCAAEPRREEPEQEDGHAR